jgi:4-hydroxyphenylpyruvate dioxygenase-like putative hemolysin
MFVTGSMASLTTSASAISAEVRSTKVVYHARLLPIRICAAKPGSAARLVAGPGSGNSAITLSVHEWFRAMNRARMPKADIIEANRTKAVQNEVLRGSTGTYVFDLGAMRSRDGFDFRSLRPR